MTSSFTKLSTYSYSVDGFSFIVDRVANSLISGLKYRFIFRSENEMGFSDFSDSVRIGLGPLPSQPAPPTRSSTGNSPTSVGVSWTALTGQILDVIEYVLYMDDGNGVIFNEVYRGFRTSTIIYNLTSGIDYSFKVSAVNFNGESSLSVASAIKSCIAPLNVKAPSLIQSTSTTVTLRWQ